MYREGRPYFHREAGPRLTGNATRRETISGFRAATAASVCARPLCACVRPVSRENRQMAAREGLAVSIPACFAFKDSGESSGASRIGSSPRARWPSIRNQACHCPPLISRPVSTWRMRTLALYRFGFMNFALAYFTKL